MEYGVKEAQERWLEDGVKKMLCVEITEPKAGDILTMQGVDYSVIYVKPFSPGDMIIYYEVAVK